MSRSLNGGRNTRLVLKPLRNDFVWDKVRSSSHLDFLLLLLLRPEESTSTPCPGGLKMTKCILCSDERHYTPVGLISHQRILHGIKSSFDVPETVNPETFDTYHAHLITFRSSLWEWLKSEAEFRGMIVEALIVKIVEDERASVE